MAIYLGCFARKKDVFQEFGDLGYGEGSGTLEDLKDWEKNCKILLAWYGQECWEGSAFVLLERDNKLYEVNGGHCSCYGLGGQWDPEETDYESLMHRIEKGTLGYYYSDGAMLQKKLIGVLKRWKRRNT